MKRIISLFLLIGSLYSAHVQASALSSLRNGARTVVKSMQENPRSWLLGACVGTAALFAGYEGYLYHCAQEAKKAADTKKRITRFKRQEAIETMQSAVQMAEIIKNDDVNKMRGLIRDFEGPRAVKSHDSMSSCAPLTAQVRSFLEGTLYEAAARGSSEIVAEALSGLRDSEDKFYAKKALRIANTHDRSKIVKELLYREISMNDLFHIEYNTLHNELIDEAIAAKASRVVDVWMEHLHREIVHRKGNKYIPMYVDYACRIGSQKWIDELCICKDELRVYRQAFNAAVRHKQWKIAIKIIDRSLPYKDTDEKDKWFRNARLREYYKADPSDELFAVIYYCAGFKKRKAYCNRMILIDLALESVASYEDGVRFLEKVFKARSMLKQITGEELEEDYGIYKTLINSCCESDHLKLVRYLIEQGCDCSKVLEHYLKSLPSDNAQIEHHKNQLVAELFKRHCMIKNALIDANNDRENCFNRISVPNILNIIADCCFRTPEHAKSSNKPLLEALTTVNKNNNFCFGNLGGQAEMVLDIIADYCPQTPSSNLSPETREAVCKLFTDFIKEPNAKKNELSNFFDRYIFEDGGSIYSLFLEAEKFPPAVCDYLDACLYCNGSFEVLNRVDHLTPQMLEKINEIRQAKKAEKETAEAQALDEKQKKEQYQQSKALFQAIKDGNEEAIIDNITKYTVNLQNEDGNTPLHVAAINGNVEAVSKLGCHGGDALDVCLNIKNKVGNIPLIAAFNEYNTQADDPTKQRQALIMYEIIFNIINPRLRSKELDPATAVKYREQKAQAKKLKQEKNDPVLDDALRGVL